MRRRTVLGAAAGLAVTAMGTACADPAERDDPSGSALRLRAQDVVRTNWALDPFAVGSYAYLPVGATPELRGLLAAPVEGHLFWAGEATDRSAPATVHGALSSGRRAAGEVADRFGAPAKIVVIGAGAAGASAAEALDRLGHDVVVLEGRDRVGGRVATLNPEGWPGPIEAGASWVHDADGHDLAQRLDAAGSATAVWDWEKSRTVGASTGDPDRQESLFEDALVDATAFAQDQDRDRSLGMALEESGAAADIDATALDGLLRREISTEYGADASDLSATWGLEEGTDGIDRLVLDSYVRVIEALLGDLDVRLGDAASRIARGPSGVTVTTASGAVEAGDAAVITVPLGVLQAEAIEFVPALPAATRAAQAGLVMGLLDKVFVRFDEVVWPDDTLAWTLDGTGPEPFRDWLNLEPLTGQPVLMALIGGHQAESWSARSDTEVRAGAASSLGQLLSQL